MPEVNKSRESLRGLESEPKLRTILDKMEKRMEIADKGKSV